MAMVRFLIFPHTEAPAVQSMAKTWIDDIKQQGADAHICAVAVRHVIDTRYQGGIFWSDIVVVQLHHGERQESNLRNRFCFEKPRIEA